MALFRGVVAVFAGLLIAGGTLTIAADQVAPQRPTLVSEKDVNDIIASRSLR